MLDSNPRYQKPWDLQTGYWKTECLALIGEKERALDCLELDLNLGMSNYPLMSELDPFLVGICGEVRFQKLMERVKYEWEHLKVQKGLGGHEMPVHGGMVKVYKVFDTKIKEKVALKLIKLEIASDRETIERPCRGQTRPRPSVSWLGVKPLGIAPTTQHITIRRPASGPACDGEFSPGLVHC